MKKIFTINLVAYMIESYQIEFNVTLLLWFGSNKVQRTLDMVRKIIKILAF